VAQGFKRLTPRGALGPSVSCQWSMAETTSLPSSAARAARSWSASGPESTRRPLRRARPAGGAVARRHAARRSGLRTLSGPDGDQLRAARAALEGRLVVSAIDDWQLTDGPRAPSRRQPLEALRHSGASGVSRRVCSHAHTEGGSWGPGETGAHIGVQLVGQAVDFLMLEVGQQRPARKLLVEGHREPAAPRAQRRVRRALLARAVCAHRRRARCQRLEGAGRAYLAAVTPEDDVIRGGVVTQRVPARARPGRSTPLNTAVFCTCSVSGLAVRARAGMRWWKTPPRTTSCSESDSGKTCAPCLRHALAAGAPPVGADRLCRERSPDRSPCARRGTFTVTLNKEFAHRALLPHYRHEKVGSFTDQLKTYVRARLPGPTLCMRA